MADNLSNIKDQLGEFFSKEAELAKAEIVPSAKKGLFGTVLAIVALTFALHAVWMLVIALAAVFTWLISLWGLSVELSLIFGFLIAAVVSLLIGAGFGFFAFRKFKQVKAPTATIAEAKATFSAITDGLSGRGDDGLPARAPGTPGPTVVDDRVA